MQSDHEADAEVDVALMAPLQATLAELEAEDAKWRDEASALERSWAEEAKAMHARWRDDDGITVTKQLREASTVLANQEAMIANYPPTPRPGWTALQTSTGRRLGELSCRRVARLCAAVCRGGADDDGGSSAAPAPPAASHGLVPAATIPASHELVPAAMIRRLFSRLSAAGAGAECEALCDSALSAFGEAALEGGGEAAAEGLVPLGALAILLLALVERATPLERLEALVTHVLVSPPQRWRHGMSLTLAEQQRLFLQLYAAAIVGSVAASLLAASFLEPPSAAPPQVPAHMPFDAALDEALRRRPLTWAVSPPGVREFSIWCVTSEPLIGAAFATSTDPRDVP